MGMLQIRPLFRAVPLAVLLMLATTACDALGTDQGEAAVLVGGTLERMDDGTITVRQFQEGGERLVRLETTAASEFLLCIRTEGRNDCEPGRPEDGEPQVQMCARALLRDGELRADRVFFNASCAWQAVP